MLNATNLNLSCNTCTQLQPKNKEDATSSKDESLSLLPNNQTQENITQNNNLSNMEISQVYLANQGININYTNNSTATASTEQNAKEDNTSTKQYTITASVLNKRNGAGTNNKITGTVKYGTSVNVVEIKDGWAKLDDGSYISAKYIKEGEGVATSKKSTSSKTTSSKTTKSSSSSKTTSGSKSSVKASSTNNTVVAKYAQEYAINRKKSSFISKNANQSREVYMKKYNNGGKAGSVSGAHDIE